MRNLKKIKKYMVQVNLEYKGKTQRFARITQLSAEPQHNDVVNVKAQGKEYSFTVLRRDIGSRQTIWVITKDTHVSKEEHEHFINDSHWHRGADAKP